MWFFAPKTGHEAVAGAKPRSPQWPDFRRRWLAAHPACAVCGRIKNVVPHHRRPVHLYPELELAEDNLISLCETGPGSTNCHCLVGHCGDWSAWNPTVEIDANYLRRMLENRIDG